MRRVVEILLSLTQETGQTLPHLQAAFGDYAGVLTEMGHSEGEVEATLAALLRRYGLARQW
jgi:hypothetical protein